MVVEPDSLRWMTGRMVEARDGVTWAEEFARLPALTAVVRDDGAGLGRRVTLERARRRAASLPDLDDTLDVSHTLREGGRALSKTWRPATRALDRADAAQKGFDHRARRGQSRQGHGAPLNRLWRHREMTQGLLDLKRLYWNLCRFRTGRGKDQTPYGRLGLKLPELRSWEFLKLTPKELPEELSALGETP
jgi:hypothetical protein